MLQESELIFRASNTIRSAETDAFGRLRPSALLNILIQSAIGSADSLGFGYEQLQEQQLFWVLSRMLIKIDRPILWKENISIETWPKSVERIIYLRDFLIKDSTGQLIGRASSGWLAIDLKNKRPKIVGERSGIFSQLQNKAAIEEIPSKLPAAKAEHQSEYQSYYSDLDVNKHVTSSRYLDWMMDSISMDFHQQYYPKEIALNYVKETMPEEQMLVYREERSEKEYLFEGINKKAESTAFRGKIIFE